MDKVSRHFRAGSACRAGVPTGSRSHSGGTARLGPRFGASGDASRLNRPPTGRNAHDRVLLHTPPVMKKARPTTLAWRNFIGAGFALPRDASRRLALPWRRASRGSAKRGCVRRQGCIFTANAHDRVRLHTPPVMKKRGPHPGMAQRHRRWFRAPARCRPEAGVPSRPRAFSRSARRALRPSGPRAGLKTGVPLPAVSSRRSAPRHGCIFTATGALRRSSLRFGRNTPGIPPSRASSAGRLTALGARPTLRTDCP